MGADEGYVFSDRRLGGADVLATSYTLSQAIRSVGDFDLILCGKQTTDGDTAQVGRPSPSTWASRMPHGPPRFPWTARACGWNSSCRTLWKPRGFPSRVW